MLVNRHNGNPMQFHQHLIALRPCTCPDQSANWSPSSIIYIPGLIYCCKFGNRPGLSLTANVINLLRVITQVDKTGAGTPSDPPIVRLRGCIKPTGRLERQIVRPLLFWLCRDRLLRLFARCAFDTPNVGVLKYFTSPGVRPLPAPEVELDGHRVTNLVAIDLVNPVLRVGTPPFAGTGFQCRS